MIDGPRRTAIRPRSTNFADEVLPSLQLDDGLFCFDRTWADPTLRGSSVRYSIMVLLGLSRRASHGKPVSTDIAALHRRIHAERNRLGVGDLGLLLWADTRLDDPVATQTLALLERQALAPGALGDLVGMEIGWLTCGAVAGFAAGLPAGAVVVAAVDELRRRETATPLLPAHRRPHPARRVAELRDPGLHAARPDRVGATRPGGCGAVPRRGPRRPARRTAAARRRLAVAVQRRPGRVVEPYEIYSVHQDAMAPMALLALDEVLGRSVTGPRCSKASSGASAATNCRSTSTTRRSDSPTARSAGGGPPPGSTCGRTQPSVDGRPPAEARRRRSRDQRDVPAVPPRLDPRGVVAMTAT